MNPRLQANTNATNLGLVVPRSSRASTSKGRCRIKGVDGRNMFGHDDGNG